MTPIPYTLAQTIRTERIETNIELARWSAGNALLVGAILTALGLYAIYWMYRREGRGQFGPRLRWAMIGCRALTLLLLGLIGLEPVLVRYVYRRLNARTLLLVDDSASMGLADSYRRPEDRSRLASLLGKPPTPDLTRAGIEEWILDGNHGRFLRRLAEKNEVRVVAFGDSVSERLSLTAATSSAPAVTIHPTAGATDVGMALRGSLEAAGAAPIAGVVLLSDGRINRGESPRALADLLKQRGVPLYAVGIGDPSEPVNAVVVEVSGPRSVFKNDPFSVSVRVSASGAAGAPVTLELLEEKSPQPPRVVDRRTLAPGRDGNYLPAAFERRVESAGSVGFSARLLPLTDESVLTDNERRMIPAVQVLDDKMRVLLVAGAPSYDYRYLARLLERDKTVDVACWLQSADIRAVRDGDIQIKELPSDQKDLFSYDAVLLLDCDPSQLDPTWGSLVATFVTDHGGGLLYQAGNKYTGAFMKSPNTAALAAMLPIAPDPDAELILNDLGQYQSRSWPLIIPDTAWADPILRLADQPSENRAIWASLEGPYWHYPVRREKPVATVLLRHSNPRMVGSFGPHVLMATQYVGAGRSAFIGFNSTWRWRRGEERAFNRFWTQTLRFLVEGRLAGGPSRCQIQTVRNEVAIGDSVVVTVRALDEQFAPLMAAELTLTLTPESAAGDSPLPRTIKLLPLPGREGHYQGRFLADVLGRLKLSLELPSSPAAEGKGSPAASQEILVSRPDLEMRQSAMNRPGLEEFALGSGGRYFDVDKAMSIPELIPDRSQTFVVRDRPRALWDNRAVLCLLVLTLSVEWVLRKKARLL